MLSSHQDPSRRSRFRIYSSRFLVLVLHGVHRPNLHPRHNLPLTTVLRHQRQQQVTVGSRNFRNHYEVFAYCEESRFWQGIVAAHGSLG